MQPIIQHLFQASSLEDVSRQRLESFVAEYPSFGIGHYLLSRKLQAEGADSYVEETQKTNLYFTNPFWLQLLLESPQDGGTQVAAPRARQEPETVAEPEPVVPAGEQETTASAAEPAHLTHAGEQEITPSTAEPEPEPVAPAVTPELAAASIEPVKDTMDNVVEESLFATSDTETHEHPQSMVSLAEAVAAAEEPTDVTAAELLLQSIEEAKGLRESLQKMNDDFNTGKPFPAAGEQIAQPATQEHTEQPIKDEESQFVLDEDVMPVAETQSPTHSPAVHTAPESADVPEAAEALHTAPEESSQATQEPAAAQTSQSISTTLAAASATLNTPVPAAEQTFVFEPYHTIDYFASQGIKLTLDENPSDQLGKQLKSFTDWLKVMRRLPQKEREIVPDRAAEQTVQTIAAHSVVGREIVTETMAEVLAKQGMPDRARAVYEKLSLLNPDKRAYFATKIEQLNSL
ncbi:MAG TPA: hypothetical protein VGN00_04475 [Puia sp.]